MVQVIQTLFKRYRSNLQYIFTCEFQTNRARLSSLVYKTVNFCAFFTKSKRHVLSHASIKTIHPNLCVHFKLW